MSLLNPGDLITCEAGHLVGEIIKPLELGQLNWGECAGNWRIEPPVIGGPVRRCFCGKRWCFSSSAESIAGMRGGFSSFHIEGRGWVPPLPEGVET